MRLVTLSIRMLCALALLLSSQVARGQAPAPVRFVDGSTVVSQQDPAARIQVASTASYVGAVRFVLFGVADCEIHLYVDADAAKRIRRLYWVQFEAYLPGRPDLRYAPHPAFRPTELGGVPFYHRARFGRSADPIQPGSEAEHVLALLRAHGYVLPEETVNVTYKHFPDSSMRKELLMIVLEDMSLWGVTVAQLVQDGQVQPAWETVATRLLQQAPSAFTVTLSPAAPR
ncbi:MAG: hypothetical protein J0M20_09540 [Burkholderiales bacterium]|nr:hypothetical protein [Burkholderiales bacterium]